MAFQGLCEASQFPLLNIDRSYMSVEYLEFFGRVNLMKGAVVLADGVSTVSPTYAREVSSEPSFGFGLEGVLRAKGSRFVGILNGADYNEWNPGHRPPHRGALYCPTDPGGKDAVRGGFAQADAACRRNPAGRWSGWCRG